MPRHPFFLSHAPIYLSVTAGINVDLSKTERVETRTSKSRSNCSNKALVLKYSAFIEKKAVSDPKSVVRFFKISTSNSVHAYSAYFSSY